MYRAIVGWLERGFRFRLLDACRTPGNGQCRARRPAKRRRELDEFQHVKATCAAFDGREFLLAPSKGARDSGLRKAARLPARTQPIHQLSILCTVNRLGHDRRALVAVKDSRTDNAVTGKSCGIPWAWAANIGPRFRTACRLTHDARQPTLDRSCESPPAEDLEALSLVEVAALLAFLRSTHDRAPISPCAGLTQALATWLEQRGAIGLAVRGDAWDASGIMRAIYDPLAWRVRLQPAGHGDLASLLASRLIALVREDESLKDKLTLWELLANAEVEGYFTHLLRKHGFDPDWALDTRDEAQRWRPGLSLSQLRYVVWASVREGAAAYLRSRGDPDEARSAISQELRRRARWVEVRPDAGLSFMPATTSRQSVLLRLFLEDIAPIGKQYWLVPPELSVLRSLLRA